MRVFLLGLFAFVLAACGAETPKIKISGEAQVWQTLTFDYQGPKLSETRETFTAYELDIVFFTDDMQFQVPGYFAADGNAAETGLAAGNIWRVKFTPPVLGNGHMWLSLSGLMKL